MLNKLSSDLYQEFQDQILLPKANIAHFISKVIAARKEANGLDRVRLASLERLANALRDFAEQRSGLADLSVLIRQFIRFNQRKIYLLPELWNLISSRAEEYHLWGLLDTDGKSVEVGVNAWNPDWLTDIDDFDRPEIRRYEPPVMGDGLLLAATGKTTYLSQAQKNAVLACLTLPPGDTLLISLPTGAGKSMCIMLPAWQDSHGGKKAGGTTLVVVPTVALAYDQERRAMENFAHSLSDHYKPWSLTGATLPQNRTIIRKALRDGTLPLLFTSPESLLNSEIYGICMGAAESGYIKRLVIDEAHIVESWGADFRAEFQYLSTFRRNLIERSQKPPTTILLSATITQNCEKLFENLFSEDGHFNILRGSGLRPEISYWFSYSESHELRKKRVFEAIYHLPRPMILFVNKPAEAEALVAELRADGFYRIAAFSGNTADEERARILSEWSQNQRDLVVATSAFGLGVDKADVRTVIHAAFPESIDRFYQEVGRGGRDGINSISLVCAANGDRRDAFDIIKTSRITPEKAISRWDSMRKGAKIVPPNEIIVDLNAKPGYNQDLIGSERHRNWNIHVLLMMERAKLIRITETNIDAKTNPTQSTTKIENWEEAQENSFLIKLEVLDTIVTNDLKRLENKIKIKRKEEVSNVLGGLKQLENLINTYVSNETRLCISKHLSSLYPAVSEACGGCPVCRKEKRKPYSMPLEILMNVQKMGFSRGNVDLRIKAKFGSHHTLNVYWDGTENLEYFKNKNGVFAQLMELGFRQLIFPDSFFEDATWVHEACLAFSSQDQNIHQILFHKSIGDPEKYYLLPVPTVTIYPNQTREADELYQQIEKSFPNSMAIPMINIVPRGLYLPSLSGFFLDKVNGLNESLSRLEETLSEQLETFDF